jgi:hypothetical protein
MLGRVALVRADVSEERVASIVRMTRIGELGRRLAVSRNQSTLRSLMIEAICSFATPVITRATLRSIPEAVILNCRRLTGLFTATFCLIV